MVWKTAVEGSEIGVHFLDQPQLVDLRYAIQECCIIYNNRAQLDISWFNIMGKGSYIKAHSHKGAFVSGAYYPYVEENSCPLIFENGVSIAPQIGMLILFPGILEHKTMPNQSEKRITVSINCNPIMQVQMSIMNIINGKNTILDFLENAIAEKDYVRALYIIRLIIKAKKAKLSKT